MNRREMLTTSGKGIGSIALISAVGGGVVIEESCGGKPVSGEIAIITGAIASLKIIYPNVAILDKIVKTANDFNAEWQAGNFDSAKTFFENLDTLVGQAISDLGVNASPRAKLLLAAIGIALRTVAALIQEQGTAQPLIAAKARTAAPKTVDRVNQLADPVAADKLLKSVRQ